MSLPFAIKGDRLVVVPDVKTEAVEPSAGGILLASTLNQAVTGEAVTESLVSGRIVAVGEGPSCPSCRTRKQSDVALGDHVVFSPLAGQEITVGEDRFVILTEKDVLAVLTEEAYA